MELWALLTYDLFFLYIIYITHQILFVWSLKTMDLHTLHTETLTWFSFHVHKWIKSKIIALAGQLKIVEESVWAQTSAFIICVLWSNNIACFGILSEPDPGSYPLW